MTEHAVSSRHPEAAARGTRNWLTRDWHLALLSLWTAAWFAGMAPAGGIGWDFFRSGTAALFGEPGSFHPPGGLHLYASNPSLQIGPRARGTSRLAAGIEPGNADG